MIAKEHILLNMAKIVEDALDIPYKTWLDIMGEAARHAHPTYKGGIRHNYGHCVDVSKIGHEIVFGRSASHDVAFFMIICLPYVFLCPWWLSMWSHVMT